MANEVMDIFLEIKKLSNIDKVVMESKNAHSGLQAADLFVYEVRKHIINELGGRTESVRPQIKILMRDKKYRGLLNTLSTVERGLRLLKKTRRSLNPNSPLGKV